MNEKVISCKVSMQKIMDTTVYTSGSGVNSA